jgi:hypothetical protein
LTDQGANSRQVWRSVQLMTYWHTNYKFQMVYFFDRVLRMVTWLFCKNIPSYPLV